MIGGARTGADGRAAVDMYATIQAYPGNYVQGVRGARRMSVRYTNPHAYRPEVQPNYGSSEATVEFRYDGPLPEVPAP